MTLKPPQTWQILVILTIAILAVSTSAIWIRLAMVEANIRGVGFSLTVAAARLTLAALILVPIRGSKVSQAPAIAIGYAVAAGLFLALHFGTWITSLSYTSIVASTALVTTNPLWVALLEWLWFGRKPTRRITLGITIALCGGFLISSGGAENTTVGTQPWLGNLLAIIGSWAVSFYLLLGREAQKRGLSLGGYSTIAYTVAALVLLPLPLVFGMSYTGYSHRVYAYLLLMALLPQLVGHAGINWAMRWVSPTLVTLAVLFEPAIASGLGYWIFGEVPTFGVFIGAAVLLVGVAIAALDSR
ncbi:MAG: DMT family transporter [Cyanobacteriota bacterium]|nr:DMT family transporter [Cyanobacteriota bacterium]